MRLSLHRSIGPLLALSLAACGPTPNNNADSATDDRPAVANDASDSGSSATDSGIAMDATPSDTGVTPADTGVGPADTGVTPADTGVSPSDSGAPLSDAGLPRARTLMIGTFAVGGRPSTSFPALLAEYGTVATMADPPINSALLRDYDLVVFGLMPNAIDGAERAALLAWTVNGGRVIVLGGYDASMAERDKVTSVISIFGMTVDTMRATIIETPTFTADAVARLDLSAPPALTGGDAFAMLTPPGARAEATVMGGATVGARYINAGAGRGRAYVWLDEWVALDAMWSANTRTFWRNVLDFLLRP